MMIKMKLKHERFICTSAIRRALRITLQDPALYLDLYREAVFCLYRLNTAFSLRERNHRRLLGSQGPQASQGGQNISERVLTSTLKEQPKGEK